MNIAVTYSLTHLPSCELHSFLSAPLYVCRLIRAITLSFTKMIAKSRPEMHFATDMLSVGGEEDNCNNITSH